MIVQKYPMHDLNKINKVSKNKSYEKDPTLVWKKLHIFNDRQAKEFQQRVNYSQTVDEKIRSYIK